MILGGPDQLFPTLGELGVRDNWRVCAVFPPTRLGRGTALRLARPSAPPTGKDPSGSPSGSSRPAPTAASAPVMINARANPGSADHLSHTWVTAGYVATASRP
ncbi:hypothetical protein Bbelb_034660 [Branchiostoma belcheri]|nr:hypothetical protein Bbelb_034660 [Branchiostoma belcheri]